MRGIERDRSGFPNQAVQQSRPFQIREKHRQSGGPVYPNHLPVRTLPVPAGASALRPADVGSAAGSRPHPIRPAALAASGGMNERQLVRHAPPYFHSSTPVVWTILYEAV
jgi:hypothetical protein